MSRSALALCLLLGASVAGAGCLEGLLDENRLPPVLVIWSYDKWWSEDSILHINVTIRNVGDHTPGLTTFPPKFAFDIGARSASEERTGVRDGGSFTLDTDPFYAREMKNVFWGPRTGEQMGTHQSLGPIGPIQIHPGQEFHFTILFKPPPEFDFEPGGGHYNVEFNFNVWQPRKDGAGNTSEGSVRFQSGCFTRQHPDAEYYSDNDPPGDNPKCHLKPIRIHPSHMIPHYQHLM